MATPKSPQSPQSPQSPSSGRAATGAFRGNKAGLPSKPCAACGLPMTWRRSWARNWEAVKYCSEACRRNRKAPGLG